MASACEPSITQKKKHKNKTDDRKEIENSNEENNTQREATLKEDFENLKQDVSDHKQNLLKLHKKLLPRERQLCMRKDEVSLDISKYFSDLRHQINRILLQEEHKMLDKLNETVEKESQEFNNASKCCKSMLEDLEQNEDLLHSFDLDNTDSSALSDTVTGIRQQLRDYRETTSTLEQKSEAPLELDFNAKLGILDEIRQFDYGTVTCICSLPVDVVYEETDMSVSEPVVEIEHPEVVSVAVGPDPESCQLPGSEDEVESSDVSASSSESSEEESDTSDEADSANNVPETTSPGSSIIPEPQEDRSSQQVASGATGIRITRQTSIPDEPPPPYPGLPEHFSGILSPPYQQQLPYYSYPCQPSSSRPSSYGPTSRPSDPIPRPSSYGAPSRSTSSPRTPSAPPAQDNYEYVRNRRSQEYIPPLSPSRYQNEDDERMYNMTVISRTNSASLGYDKRKPGIAGICWVSASFLLIADRWNCCIKLVHQSAGTYRILSFQNFEPWGITRVEAETSAVTLPKARKLYTILHSNGNMTIKSSIVTAKGYSSIAYCKSASLYIGAVCPIFGHPCVEILDMRGVIQSNFSLDRYQENLFEYPRSIEVVEDSVIAVSDYKKGCVTLMRMDGQMIGSYTGSQQGCKLKDPQGIAAYDQHKVLFVVDSKQNAVHTVTSTGEYKGVLKDRENMLDPKRACLWKDGGPLKIAVALGTGYITTFRLEELHEYV